VRGFTVCLVRIRACSVLHLLTRFLSVLFFIAPTAQDTALYFRIHASSLLYCEYIARGYMYNVLMYFSTFHDTVVLFGMVVVAIQHLGQSYKECSK
jgi:hypothetical protein